MEILPALSHRNVYGVADIVIERSPGEFLDVHVDAYGDVWATDDVSGDLTRHHDLSRREVDMCVAWAKGAR